MITFKGLKQGLLAVFSGSPDEPWLTHLRELEAKLSANPKFFKGGSMAFDVRAMPLSEDDLRRAISLLRSYEVTLWAVLSQDEATCARVRALGLTDQLMPAEPADEARHRALQLSSESLPIVALPMRVQPDEPSQTFSTEGILVRRWIRSGQVLHHPGHIVVIGDVNPGAQLIAGGDIIVWGKLHGSAYAGALGDQRATVCALEMNPSLVRIADIVYIPRPSEWRKRGQRSKAHGAKVARIQDQEIVFLDWDCVDRKLE